MTSLEFAEAARQMGSVIRREGYTVPTFRSPPRSPGQSRSILRRPDGSATVAVALRGRAMVAIAADMIDGVIAANQLEGPAASLLRDALWEAVAEILVAPSNRRSGVTKPSSHERDGSLCGSGLNLIQAA